MGESGLRSAIDYLKIPDDGSPYLEGYVCGNCEAVFLGKRTTCSRCGTRDSMHTKVLANTGTLYAFSVVYRSYPGIEVPYISAIVDLDGGGTVKGNLIGVEPDPQNIKFGMPVQLVFADALGRKDQNGNLYLAYFFQPHTDS